MKICLLENTGTTTISSKPTRNKHQKEVAIISESPSTSSWPNARKEDKTCDSNSNNDNSEASTRSDYIKKENKRKLLLTLSNKFNVRKLNRVTDQEDEKSVGLYGAQDLDDKIQQQKKSK